MAYRAVEIGQPPRSEYPRLCVDGHMHFRKNSVLLHLYGIKTDAKERN